MIRKDLLEKELEWSGIKLKPKKFNRDEVYNLFKKYKNYGMTESSYCCSGEVNCCWQELIEEGVWLLTLEDVRNNIWSNIKYFKHYIRSRKDGDRFYMYKDKEKCLIYIYARDTELQMDLNIWFSNEEV